MQGGNSWKFFFFADDYHCSWNECLYRLGKMHLLRRAKRVISGNSALAAIITFIVSVYLQVRGCALTLFRAWDFSSWSAHAFFSPYQQDLEVLWQITWFDSSWLSHLQLAWHDVFSRFSRNCPLALCESLASGRDMLTTPSSMETSVLLNKQMPQLSHMQIDIHAHTYTHFTYQETGLSVCQSMQVCPAVTNTHTTRVSHGLNVDSEALWTEISFVFPERQWCVCFPSVCFLFFFHTHSLLFFPFPLPLSSLPPLPYLIYRMTICDLYTMPRVAEPVWLTMMSGASEKNQLCGQFMREFSLLMEQASKNQWVSA